MDISLKGSIIMNLQYMGSGYIILLIVALIGVGIIIAQLILLRRWAKENSKTRFGKKLTNEKVINKSFNVVFIGGPAQGKTTLNAALIKAGSYLDIWKDVSRDRREWYRTETAKDRIIIKVCSLNGQRRKGRLIHFWDCAGERFKARILKDKDRDSFNRYITKIKNQADLIFWVIDGSKKTPYIKKEIDNIGRFVSFKKGVRTHNYDMHCIITHIDKMDPDTRMNLREWMSRILSQIKDLTQNKSQFRIFSVNPRNVIDQFDDPLTSKKDFYSLLRGNDMLKILGFVMEKADGHYGNDPKKEASTCINKREMTGSSLFTITDMNKGPMEISLEV